MGDMTREIALQDEVEALNQRNADLEKELAQAETEIKQLQDRIEVLADLPKDVKGENIYKLSEVRLAKHTGFYDKDDDGVKESLIVYIEPVDAHGDIIKATGSIGVELWNLENPNGQAKLGHWEVRPEELAESWFNTLMRTNFRLTFDVSQAVSDFSDPLTVKLTFIDHLSGNAFKQQHVIEPAEAP